MGLNQQLLYQKKNVKYKCTFCKSYLHTSHFKKIDYIELNSLTPTITDIWIELIAISIPNYSTDTSEMLIDILYTHQEAKMLYYMEIISFEKLLQPNLVYNVAPDFYLIWDIYHLQLTQFHWQHIIKLLPLT